MQNRNANPASKRLLAVARVLRRHVLLNGLFLWFLAKALIAQGYTGE